MRLNIKKIIMVWGLWVPVCGLAASPTAVEQSPQEATEPAPKKPVQVHPWKGTDLQAGAVINSGNTNSQNYNVAANIKYTYKKWVATEDTTYQRASSSDKGTTADKFFTQGQLNFNFTEHNFVYTQANYTRDIFSGFTYVVNYSIGYGRRIPVMPASMTLDIFAGPGMRFDKESETDHQRTDASVQIGVNYAWNITQATAFDEQFQITMAKDNTNTSSKSALVTTLSTHLGFSINFLITNDSQPASGKQNVNTSTTLNLAYNF